MAAIFAIYAIGILIGYAAGKGWLK